MKSFDPHSAYNFMEHLVSDIGNRESGTDAEARAAQKIKGWFEDLKLANVRIEEFEVQTSRVLKEEASLPDGTNVPCAAVGNSLSTPKDGIAGEVVLLESMSLEALGKIKSKIAALGIVPNQKDFNKILKA